MFGRLNNVGPPDFLLNTLNHGTQAEVERMQQQLEEERAQAQRRVAWLQGECSRFEITITAVRLNVQHARDETRPSPQSSLWGDSPAG